MAWHDTLQPCFNPRSVVACCLDVSIARFSSSGEVTDGTCVGSPTSKLHLWLQWDCMHSYEGPKLLAIWMRYYDRMKQRLACAGFDPSIADRSATAQT